MFKNHPSGLLVTFRDSLKIFWKRQESTGNLWRIARNDVMWYYKYHGCLKIRNFSSYVENTQREISYLRAPISVISSIYMAKISTGSVAFKTVSYENTYLSVICCSERCLHSAKLVVLRLRWTSIRNEKLRSKRFLPWNVLGKGSSLR